MNRKQKLVDLASRCTNKEKIVSILLKLNRTDDYGVRDTLIYCAGDFLSEPNNSKGTTTIA